jgi:hypothetical protein
VRLLNVGSSRYADIAPQSAKRSLVNELNADCLALPPDHFAKFSSTRVGNQRDLEPAWQKVYNFDNKFCAGSRQIAQAAFVVRQTMGCDPCRLAAPPPHFAFGIFTSQPVQRNAPLRSPVG